MGIFWKVDFLNTAKAKVIILTWYVETNETMAINKFQRSWLTFALSAKVAHIVVKLSFLTNYWPNWAEILCEESLW